MASVCWTELSRVFPQNKSQFPPSTASVRIIERTSFSPQSKTRFSPSFPTLKSSNCISFNNKSPNVRVCRASQRITLDPERPNPLSSDDKREFKEKIDSCTITKGLSEETVRLISSRKNEPDWLLEFRLNSYHELLKMTEPKWSDNRYPRIDFQDMCYYSEPKSTPTLNSLEEADSELVRYLRKLGMGDVAVDAVGKSGVILCKISEAVRECPDLVKKYLGRVVRPDDNYYAALNSAVFSDGLFCYVPQDMQIPMSFRVNALGNGQFERTLIVAEDRSFVECLEWCKAPSNYDEKNRLHGAVVELYCGEGAEINYSTVQDLYAGDEEGKGGIYNFVTKQGLCAGARSKISLIQVETGSAITWTNPSVVLEGDDTVGELYSVALTNNYQQAETGTKMIHKGKNTRSRILSKGISAGNSRNCYRGLVQVHPSADNARNSLRCDSMLIGDNAAANTYPLIQAENHTARIEQEASTCKIGEDQLFYFQQRGIDHERAMVAMISGFCRDVFNELPNEFGAEVNQLISLKLEGSVR